METYVIRLASEAAADEAGDALHGVVEHVDSGRREVFRGGRELLAFLRTEHPRQREEAER